MAATHAVSTGRYLFNTSAVLTAGRLLQDALSAEFDVDTLDYAATQLSEAAKSQGSEAKSYRAFMLSELKVTAVAATEKKERIGEDVIGSVLVDLQIANVLMAAGNAVGEVDGKAQPELLDQALNDLDQTQPVIARELASPLAKGTMAGRFNFSGTVAGKEEEKVFQSANPDSAVQTFKKVSDETLEQLVTGVYEVAVGVVDALKKLSPEKVLDALSQLGGPVKAISGMARRLISQGIQKMKQAINDLTNLIGNDAIKKVKDKVEEIWRNHEQGIALGLLGKIIGVETTRATITNILGTKGIDKTLTDQGSTDVARLLAPYRNNMLIANKIVKAISFGSSLLLLTPITGPKIALFTASSYLIVLASVILIAMDYADSGGILRLVRGVGEIANSLRPIGADAAPSSS
jgi:hypothetical protein